MARRKNQPESVRVKCHLSERLRLIRTELFGERGGSEMARRLGLPIRTWYNYEGGVTVPAEVLLRFVELTSVEPLWLLHGRGPKFRVMPLQPEVDEASSTVGALLRSALERLEQRSHSEDLPPPRIRIQPPEVRSLDEDVVLIGVENGGAERLTGSAGPRFIAARREWLRAERDCRCIRVEGDAMAPIVADQACVAFAAQEDEAEQLDGKMVVAWVESRVLVRWFRRMTGNYGLLRAENPVHEPNTLLIDLEASAESQRLRRVLWISTPH
jgi:hypothetical protein